MRRSEKIIYIVFGTLLFLSLVTSISYALWSVTRTQEEPNQIASGCFSLTMVDGTRLELTNEFPVPDADGLQKEPYTFTIENTCSIGASVHLKLLTTNDTTIQLEHIKVALDGDATVAPKLLSALENGTTSTADISHTKILTNTYIPGNTTHSYELRLWLDEAVTKEEERNTRLEAKVEIDGEAAPEPPYADASGATSPILDNGLIPVVYQDNKWVKADVYEKWYDYNAQWWANAVTVKEASRSTYADADAGTEIPMSAINTMWVWIPRYEYQTDNLTYIEDNTLHNQYAGGTQDQPGGINIHFVSQETTTASASNFLIHPAFTFGTQELTGMWVAKFEMSPAAGTTCATTSNTANCDITTFAPEIKPNVVSWRNARVGTFFTAIQNQMNGSNGTTTYGLTNSDTHMMKNMEWGAVAYLSQSKYGKYGNTTYTGTDKEVAINNCDNWITGIGGDTVSASSSSATCTTNTYETAKGQAASTTGNIYGIYDMSGGAYEYVMGVLKESTNSEVVVGSNTTNNSGFSGKLYNGTPYEGTYGALKDIDTKYYDIYNYGITQNDAAAYQRGYQGDATKEVVGWYQDFAIFTIENRPWIARSGGFVNSVNAGIFAFVSLPGIAVSGYSTRPVLVSAAS